MFENPEVEVVYPVHLSPAVQSIATEILGDIDRVHLIEPLDVVDFHNLAAHSYLILTDSGGIQEEAPSLNVPVLVLRDTTERPEGVDATQYRDMADNTNPYGDGHTAERIVYLIKQFMM